MERPPVHRLRDCQELVNLPFWVVSLGVSISTTSVLCPCLVDFVATPVELSPATAVPRKLGYVES